MTAHRMLTLEEIEDCIKRLTDLPQEFKLPSDELTLDILATARAAMLIVAESKRLIDKAHAMCRFEVNPGDPEPLYDMRKMSELLRPFQKTGECDSLDCEGYACKPKELKFGGYCPKHQINESLGCNCERAE